MKIAIPVNEGSLESKVAENLSRAPYFLIYDLDAKESVFIKNVAATTRGGAGIMAAQTIVDQKVNALLAPRCGENAADLLNEAEIKIYKISSTSIKDNIKDFSAGNLQLLDDIHPGFHGQKDS